MLPPASRHCIGILRLLLAILNAIWDVRAFVLQTLLKNSVGDDRAVLHSTPIVAALQEGVLRLLTASVLAALLVPAIVDEALLKLTEGKNPAIVKVSTTIEALDEGVLRLLATEIFTRRLLVAVVCQALLKYPEGLSGALLDFSAFVDTLKEISFRQLVTSFLAIRHGGRRAEIRQIGPRLHRSSRRTPFRSVRPKSRPVACIGHRDYQASHTQ